MRVLITGGLGHIGSELVYRGKWHDVTVLDNLSSQRYCSLFDAPPIKFVKRDIFDDLRDLGPFDVVVHLAGIINAAEIEKDPDYAYKVNTAGTSVMARRCEKWGAKMILASTTSVYQGGDGWLTENSPLEPPTHYAKSKVAAEVAVMNIPGNNYVIFRFGTVFGWSIGMRFDTVVNRFCWDAFLGNPIKIWRDSKDKFRPYLGINDCVTAIQVAAETDLVGIYNVVTDHFTPQMVAEEVLRYTKGKVEYIDDPILSQESYRVSGQKLEDLGFKPEDTLDFEVKYLLSQLGVT